jgi:hypothetical protein
MTEAGARELLRRHDGWGGIEAWIASRRWQATPGGWTVTGELQGWRFSVEVIEDGLQIRADEPGFVPAVWTIRAAGRGTGAG